MPVVPAHYIYCKTAPMPTFDKEADKRIGRPRKVRVPTFDDAGFYARAIRRRRAVSRTMLERRVLHI